MDVLVWGTGQLSWHIINDYTNGEIVGFIDTYKKEETFSGKPIYSPNKLEGVEYDAIIVAISQTQGVIESIAKYNIDASRVIFAYGNVRINDYNHDYEFVEKVCGSKLRKRIETRHHLVRSIDSNLDEYELFDGNCTEYKNDYVRIKTFELLVKEIQRSDITGNVAELGVYRGDFAKYINYAFPERKLYLFDTFDGFDEEELKREVSDDLFISGQQVFKKTSKEIVEEKMHNIDSCIFKVGFFPETAKDIEDTFAFVSIDCDWEQSIYEGIKYFYPRLSGGGYIMIHDYNNYLGCAQKALSRYEESQNIKIPKVPICDNQGSLILTK
ncbi:TylF/MycF/NovP-related O-methyltransferase [Butyrivibrio sp. WCD2001]|uniref:TylF/MycF/NovP-related O-methyltransferase n=1 Tax=Butyrivibrio sp. WCD2001 TaxID=1280681 RepID=UPI00041AE644|nr:TylF/MycF/NovP-related O-methyltransferase [Butyrivibrio sp. WCD2001]